MPKKTTPPETPATPTPAGSQPVTVWNGGGGLSNTFSRSGILHQNVIPSLQPKDTDDKKIGRLLTKLRTDKHLTLEEAETFLAGHNVSIGAAALGGLERGAGSKPTKALAADIANAYVGKKKYVHKLLIEEGGKLPPRPERVR